ncbi:MAG: hypothetical protein D6677_06325 [Calditrichaeota bacterium]|nr:MAG: hypothetical protein D6677_06325 [Calditrichota bacterium]
MADEEVKEQEAPQAPPPKKSKTGLYLIIIVVQLLVAGFLIWKYVFPEYEEIKTKNDVALGRYEVPEAEKGGDGEKGEEGEPPQIGPLYALDNLTINPKGSRGMRFAVVGMSLELPSEEDVPVMDQYKLVLTDNLIAYLRNKSVRELSDASTMDSMKVDVKNLVNELLGREIVKNVYFSQFVLQ